MICISGVEENTSQIILLSVSPKSGTSFLPCGNTNLFPKLYQATDMKKVVFITAIYAFISLGWLLTSCDSTPKDSQKEYVDEQADAHNEADEARTEIQQADTSQLTEVRDELADAAKELEAARKNYMTELQTRQKTLNEKISDLDGKVTDPKQANRDKWVEKRQKLVRERDKLQANLMELQRPMTDERWTTAEKEIKDLMATIDEELKE